MDAARALELFRSASGAREAGICPLLPTQSGKPPKTSSPLFGMKSVLVGIFPYDCGREEGEICLYARGRDYHSVIMPRLEAAADALRAEFPGVRFLSGCDASPLNEVRAAALAGLGFFGDHGLFISRRFGSFVFIGTLACDAEFALSPAEPEGCSHCGACRRACPTGVLSGGDKRTECLSAITQKKGELNAAEAALLQKCGTLWGCDACQLACPHNRSAETDPLPEFTQDRITHLPRSLRTASDAEWEAFLAGRAFAWRGKEVLRRNLELLCFTKPAENDILKVEFEDMGDRIR
ncbi:MAG: epoxyqueuosine reductase [Clostridia bacterium]|nr:epoxyqueuosine reductase [Clostridia bacterium]